MFEGLKCGPQNDCVAERPHNVYLAQCAVFGFEKAEDACINTTLVKLEGVSIELPDRFLPGGDMVRWHRELSETAGFSVDQRVKAQK